MAEEKAKRTKRPTAVKRNIRNAKRCLINKSFKSSVRTAIRRFDKALVEGDQDLITTSLNAVYSSMDKGVKRGIFKLNKASRVKSRLTARATAKLA